MKTNIETHLKFHKENLNPLPGHPVAQPWTGPKALSAPEMAAASQFFQEADKPWPKQPLALPPKMAPRPVPQQHAPYVPPPRQDPKPTSNSASWQGIDDFDDDLPPEALDAIDAQVAERINHGNQGAGYAPSASPDDTFEMARVRSTPPMQERSAPLQPQQQSRTYHAPSSAADDSYEIRRTSSPQVQQPQQHRVPTTQPAPQPVHTQAAPMRNTIPANVLQQLSKKDPERGDEGYQNYVTDMIASVARRQSALLSRILSGGNENWNDLLDEKKVCDSAMKRFEEERLWCLQQTSGRQQQQPVAQSFSSSSSSSSSYNPPPVQNERQYEPQPFEPAQATSSSAAYDRPGGNAYDSSSYNSMYSPPVANTYDDYSHQRSNNDYQYEPPQRNQQQAPIPIMTLDSNNARDVKQANHDVPNFDDEFDDVDLATLDEQPVLSQLSQTRVQSNREMNAHQKARWSQDWSSIHFDHHRQLMNLAKEMFGYRSFRTNQREVMNAILSKRDCFVLMPTGGGKSLCYQLPASMNRGTTVVFSPLVSLIQDQVSHLHAADITAGTMSGGYNAEGGKQLYSDLFRDNCKLLYVTPEKLGYSDSLLNLLRNLDKKGLLNFFVIDEAHCVYQWGHEFRADYLNLDQLKKEFPHINIMALTATASESVQTNVIRLLGLQNCQVFQQSFNRTNLTYRVVKKKGGAPGAIKMIIEMIKKDHPGECGIIYCLSKKDCETNAASLQKNGIKAAHYHAGMPHADREATQNAWSEDRLQVIVATIAFGMGINKSNVRFVYHFTLPKSIEGYYQESGRAGRDGLPAECIVFYAGGDKSKVEYVITMNKQGDPPKSRDVVRAGVQKLNQMVQYCENDVDCRRAMTLNFFGEKFDPRDCDEGCDNCCKGNVDIQEKDVTIIMQTILRIVKEIALVVDRRKATKPVIVMVCRGNKMKDDLVMLAESKEYKAGKDWSPSDIERILVEMQSYEFLEPESSSKRNRMGFSNTTTSFKPGTNAYKLMKSRPGDGSYLMKFRKKGTTTRKRKSVTESKQQAAPKPKPRAASQSSRRNNANAPAQGSPSYSRTGSQRRVPIPNVTAENYNKDAKRDIVDLSGDLFNPTPDAAMEVEDDEVVSYLTQIQKKELAGQLRKVRTMLLAKAADRKLTGEAIIKDVQITEIVDRLPQSTADLHGITGLNKNKVKKWGQAFLAPVLAILQKYDIHPPPFRTELQDKQDFDQYKYDSQIQSEPPASMMEYNKSSAYFTHDDADMMNDEPSDDDDDDFVPVTKKRR